MSREPASRLGEPIELPWWVIPLAVIPILVAIGGLIVPAPPAARLAAVVPSLGLVALIARVARRVVSPSMQSVWISAAYGIWVVFPLAWAVAAFGPSR
jgi:hypothetical protein